MGLEGTKRMYINESFDPFLCQFLSRATHNWEGKKERWIIKWFDHEEGNSFLQGLNSKFE